MQLGSLREICTFYDRKLGQNDPIYWKHLEFSIEYFYAVFSWILSIFFAYNG